MAKKRQAKASKVVSRAERAKLMSDRAVSLAEYAARALVAAEELPEWREPIGPEAFDAKKATRKMGKVK